MKRFLSVLVITTLLVTMFSVNPVFTSKVAAADEYDSLREKWKVVLTGGDTYDPSDPDIAPVISKITSDAQEYWDSMDKSTGRTYLWSDLNSSTVSGYLATTYGRIRTMTSAYTTRGSSLQNNSALLNDIISALDWLYTNKYNEMKSEYDNWFDWEVNIPLSLNDMVVLLYDNLTATQVTNYMNAIEHFQPTVTMTGANRIYECMVIGLRGIIVKDSTKITAARDGLSPVFNYVTSGDGFYTDGSFVQHTKHPYNGGYGKELINHLSNIVYLLSGSTWQVTDSDVQNLYKWIYDSFEPFIYKGALMDMIRGREISRYTNQDHEAAKGVIRTIIRLSQFAPSADAVKYKSMVKYWIQNDSFVNTDTGESFYSGWPIERIVLAKAIVNDPGITPRGELIKHQTFNSMDRAVHLRPGFGFGLSMYSSRIYNYESINNENLKGWHTGDGMTYLYNNDLAQYSDDFWCTVNPYRLPGTTVDTQTRSNASGQSQVSANSWVGGTDILGLYGISGMKLNGYGVTLGAKKSWFMFDDEIVALGSDITSTDSRTIETIVENRKINSSGNNTLTVNGTEKSSALGWSETMSGTNWIHLAGNVSGADIGYYFPQPATVNGLREARTGKWSAVNSYNKVLEAGNPDHTRNYMTLWFDHGTNPTAQMYSYVLLPNKSAFEVSSYSSNPDVRILENSADAQAVKENKLNVIGVNFWNDITKTVDIITSNKKASVMTKENEGQDIEVAVCDPTQSNTGTIDIEINKTAKAVISSDIGVTVTQLSPTIKLSVNVNGSKGKTFRAKFDTTAGTLSDMTINASADAYVRGGTYANTNYAAATGLVVKKDTLADNNRKAYVKFDFNTFGGTTASLAKLKLYVSGVNTDPLRTIKVYGTTETWTETGITWNNAPAGSTYISSLNISNTPGVWYEVDVTSYINSHMTDKVVSFLLVNEGTASAKGDFSFCSREGSNVPELVISYTN